MKKHSIRNLFIILFTLCILPVSSVMLISACSAVAPASAKSDMISVTYRFDESEILNWLDTKQFTKNLRVLSLPGEPLALYRVANILLPPYNEVADVSVVEKIGGHHIVRDIPCGQPPAIIGEEPTIVGKNANIYNSDELYPDEIYRVGSVKSFHGYNILSVQLHPVQYKPASKLALYYEEMIVQVKLKEGSTIDTLRNLVKGRETVETLVDNPSILSTYDSTLDTADSTLITTETLGTTYEYIIVTTPDLADEFQVLADWKAYFVDGVKVVTVNVDASETEIKSVINDYYTNYNTSYVLLGGDVGKITYHTKMVSVPGRTANIAEDYWFANLDGDDDISYYEVYIGRAPVDTEEETVNFVNKVITYEQMDKPKANLFHQSRCDSGNVPDSRELAWQCEQYVPADYVDYELFEENGRIEKNDWINFWNNDGVMCQHEGHGAPTVYLINYEVPYVYPEGEVAWYNTDVPSLNNTFWPVHTSPTCSSGRFAVDDCLAEVYVKDLDNGAIACLFNDREGWYSRNDATMFSGDFIEMQFKALYQDGWTSIGAMLAHSKHYFIDEANSDPYWEWCFREINLFGDPETPLLTKRAQPVMNIVKNSGWETGDNSFWNVSIAEERKSDVHYEVNQDSACNGTYGFHVSMETDSGKPRYTTQSLMEYQSLSHAMLDTNTKLKYRIYPAYELYDVSEIPEARWELILSFSTGNKLHYYSSLNMEPTENSTDKYVYMPINLSQWNEFFDKNVLETYTSQFGTPPIGTIITKIAAYVTSKTYADKKDEFNRVIANFDSDEVTEGLQCTIWYVKNVDTGLNYTSIQEAINAPETLDGHTISVLGPFHEHLTVNKSLTLMGQDPSTTIIDGSGTGNVVTVQANNSAISRFRIQDSYFGVHLEYVQNSTVSDNIVSNNTMVGIWLTSSNGNVVSGNTISDAFEGIKLELECNNNTISDNKIHDGDYGIHQSPQCNLTNISNNIISNLTKYGIWIEGLPDPSYYSSGNNIINNMVSNVVYTGGPPGGYGLCLFWCSDNSIIDNTLSNNDVGLLLFESNNNTIIGNTVSSSISQAIAFDFTLTSNNIVYHNNFMDMLPVDVLSLGDIWDDGYPSGGNFWSDYTGQDQDGDGIGDTPYVIDENNQDNYPLMHPWGSIRNVDTGLIYLTIQKAIDAPETLDGHTIEVKAGTYYEEVVVNKSLMLIGEDPSNTIIYSGSWGDSGFLVYSNDTAITGFAVRSYTKCIDLWGCNCKVSGNAFENFEYAIYMEESSSNNIISNNDLSTWGGSYGIYLDFSDSNTISGNLVTDKFIGVYMRCSDQNTITDNTFSYCTIGPISQHSGMYLLESNNNVISGNTITNNEDYGIRLNGADNTVSNNTISDNESTGILVGGDDNTINDNTISNNWYVGIYISWGSFNTVSGNTISNNDCGIVLDDNNNTIVENTIQNNGEGIYSYAASNTFYHNNFVNNTQQVVVYYSNNNWDDGYPSGGNLWSDYNGTDLYSGPYQNETGSDGIGDTPYIIDENNQDNYPLIQPANLVENIDTGLKYSTIQEAIDAPETLDGHTVQVYVGTYYEQVVVSKSLTIKGLHPSTCIIDSAGQGDASVLVHADNVAITGLTIQNISDAGILLDANNSTISGNTIIEGPFYAKYGIYISSTSSNIIISNNTITKDSAYYGAKYGIFLSKSSGHLISNNNVLYSADIGIYLCDECDENTISGNTISNNGYMGIYMLDSDNNTISGNTISNTWLDSGLKVLGCDGNLFSGNIITDSDYKGFNLFTGHNNVIVENTIQNNGQGIYSYAASNNVIHHNNFINNDEQIYLIDAPNNTWDDGEGEGNYWSDYNGTDNDKDGIGDTYLPWQGVDWYPLIHPWGSIRNIDTGLTYVTIQKAINAPETSDGDAIEVKAGTYSEEVVVNKSLAITGEDPSTTIIDGGGTDNVVTVQANNVRISQFTIQNGQNGIYLESSNNTSVSGNMVLDTFHGIFVYHNSNYNTISGNTAPTIIVVNASNNNVISGNTVLYTNRYFAGILLDSSSYNTVCDNTVLNFDTFFGIYLRNSIGNSVTDNTISNNTYGINLGESSSNNTISGNTMSNGYYGIYLYGSSGNVIHHNNFINNTVHVAWGSSNTWNSINLVGNYWDNYGGEDQNGDGIGDTLLPHLEVDWYPLMWKWFPGDLDGDGDVDADDLFIFSGAYGSQMGDPNYNPIADLDYDGDIDSYDLAILAGNYGKSDP